MTSSTASSRHPVVLRYEAMSPSDLRRYEAHMLRTGGDLSHVDGERSELNRQLLGRDGWVARALDEIDEMRLENFEAETDGLRKRNRKKDLQARMLEGPRDPWRASRHGPMREVILTAHRDWFDGDIESFLGAEENERVEQFQSCAVSWLKYHFGADVIHARADLDEAAYHVHAVIMPRATVRHKREGKLLSERRMLQPSVHPMIANYEAAQTNVGEWFSSIGLVRGERRKQAWRNAVLAGETPEPKVQHKRTRKWREEQDQKRAGELAGLQSERKQVARQTAAAEQREREADEVLSYVDAVVDGRIDPEELETPASDGDVATQTTTPGRMQRARTAFRRAFGAMRKDAAARERARLEKAFSAALGGVRKALGLLGKAERLLPKDAAERLSQLRTAAQEGLDRSMLDFAREALAQDRPTPARTPPGAPKSDPRED
jgi:hypothetical protein